METALVTGAAGFIGSHLVEDLLDRGWTVRGLDDLSAGDRANLEPVIDHDAFRFVEGDVRDPAVVGETMDGVDCVFHQAAVASVPKSFDRPRAMTETNCTGTATVLEATADAGVESAVVASSSAVYGSGGELPKREDMSVAPESPYALSKYYTEQLALQLGEHHGIDVTALRYFNVFGPRQDPQGEYAAVIPKFIELLLADERPIIYGDGEQTRDFVYVGDVVQANRLAVESDTGGGVLNVARGERTSINELVERLNAILGTDIDPKYDEPRPGDIRHSGADVSKAREVLGYEPGVNLESELERTVQFFQER